MKKDMYLMPHEGSMLGEEIHQTSINTTISASYFMYNESE